MSYLTQKTIKDNVYFEGIALHSGKNVNIIIKPADPNFGIVFKRTDIKENNFVYPNFANVTNTSLNTTVENEFGIRVSTIEHLMGALYGLGIDNLVVEVNSQELPIFDGSARVFIENILNIGIEISSAPIKLIKIEKEISYAEGAKSITLGTSKVASEIDFEIKYKNPIIGTQRNKINVFSDELEDIFNSRTFCLFHDVEKLQKAGLAKGGSLENAIVVGENEILNKEGLRNPKEFVNHKILDCIGDLFTSGYRIVGSVYCSKGGHFLTNELLRKVFKNSENFSIIEIKERNLPHNLINRSLLKSIA